MKITQRSMANQAQIGPDFLSQIIRGRRRCPPDVAVRLEGATGICRVTWVWGSPAEIQDAVRQCKTEKRRICPAQAGKHAVASNCSCSVVPGMSERCRAFG